MQDRSLYEHYSILLGNNSVVILFSIQHRTQTQILDSLDLYSLASIEQLTKPEQQLAS